MHVHMCVLKDCNRAFVQSLPIMHAYVSVPSRKHQHFAQALEAQYQILTQQHLAQALEAQHQTPLRNNTVNTIPILYQVILNKVASQEPL